MIVALVVLSTLAIAGGVAVAVFAVRTLRSALERVVSLASEQAERDADERHGLVVRLQHPEVVQPFRKAPEQQSPPVQTAGLGLAGVDVSHLTDAEIVEEFGKDILNALG